MIFAGETHSVMGFLARTTRCLLNAAVRPKARGKVRIDGQGFGSVARKGVGFGRSRKSEMGSVWSIYHPSIYLTKVL